jgi:hypothetical protein
MRSRAVLVAYLVVAVVSAAVAIPLARILVPAGMTPSAVLAAPAGGAAAGQAHVIAQPSPPAPVVRAPDDPDAVKAPDYVSFFGWALLDRKTGHLAGSANRDSVTNTTESMVKAWIAADYLRHQSAGGKQPAAGAVNELYQMIIHSNDVIASKYYRLNGGDASIPELFGVCGLTTSKRPMFANSWSYTQLSPADAVRMGQCIATGKAAGPAWTGWLLRAMREVTGGVADQISVTRQGGHWGIIDALPRELAAQTSIKNGWTAQIYDHNWHVNCLAIHPDWVLAIELRYPWTSPNGDWHRANNLRQGAEACRQVTQQLLVTPDV